MYVRDKSLHCLGLENLEEKDHLENVVINGRLILKKLDGMLLTGCICLKRGTSAFDLLKLQWISAPDVEVVSSRYRIYLVCLVSYLTCLLCSVMVCVTDAMWRTNYRPVAWTWNKQWPNNQPFLHPKVLLLHGFTECLLRVIFKTWEIMRGKWA